MPKRSSKPSDPNAAAASILADLMGSEGYGKNPAAVALGRLGGLKGGKARAATLSPKRRTAIARKAAKRRWAKKA